MVHVGGTLEAVINTDGAAYTTDTDNFLLGDLRVDTSDEGNASADLSVGEVIVYNRALTEDEIEGVAEWLQANIGVDASKGGSAFAEEGLLGYWTFDEGSGSVAGDVAGSSRNATVRNGEPTWTEGRHGKAIEFNGDSEKVRN